METTTLLILFSCILSLIFLATVAWALVQINKQLAPIGGTPESFLAKLRLGLRAIDKQSSHLGILLRKINNSLEKIEGGLGQLAENLKK